MARMAKETGSIAIRHGDRIYSLLFVTQGWMAADIVRYLDDVLASETPEVEILKLLGYTMQIQSKFPPRKATHWVEVDLERKELRTNSDLIRLAVHQGKPQERDPYTEESSRALYEVLDSFDFTVKLF